MKKAFTLAEVMIVLAILGVVASLTIPATVKRQKEASERLKLKKAMAVYEHVLSMMVVENDLRGNEALIEYACNDGCVNAKKYFKQYDAQGCVFKTADNVWWDISDITRPLIGFNYDDITGENVNNNPHVYHFVGHFDNNGNFRANDSAYELSTGSDESAYLESLYDYVGRNKKEYTKPEETQTNPTGGTPSPEQEPQTIGGPWFTGGGDNSPHPVCDENGENCHSSYDYDEPSSSSKYDENGNLIEPEHNKY